MKVDNFVLLIISIVTLIIISLLTECNRGRLTELENKATKEIVEAFFHTNSALSTESGQWGYKITDITEGQYGGRSKQEVLHNIGGHNQGEYITETEKQQYENSIGSDRINITNQDWRNSINSYDCDYELGNDCLWVNPNNIGSEVSKYDPSGVFAKAINIETQANYGNCDVNDGEIVTTSTKENIQRTCNANTFNSTEDSVDICNKYYVKDPKNTDLNQNSKVYAKKITYYEGIYGGITVDDSPLNVNTVFKANDSDNNNIDGQDTPDSDDKIIRFKKCSNSDIQNNPALRISDNIINERKKSLQITFTRVWSNNEGDLTTNDDENHPVDQDGMTKWKIEIDDGNWEGLQIDDIDNLQIDDIDNIEGSQYNNHQLNQLENKYIRHSTKESFKSHLLNIINQNKDAIKNLLNFDDTEFDDIKINLFIDENPDDFQGTNVCEMMGCPQQDISWQTRELCPGAAAQKFGRCWYQNRYKRGRAVRSGNNEKNYNPKGNNVSCPRQNCGANGYDEWNGTRYCAGNRSCYR